jgi:hypothetical protein
VHRGTEDTEKEFAGNISEGFFTAWAADHNAVRSRAAAHSVQNDNAGLTTESAKDRGKAFLVWLKRKDIGEIRRKASAAKYALRLRVPTGNRNVRFPEKDLGTLRSE